MSTPLPDRSLAADVYRAAVNSAHWPDLLDRVARGCGARGAAILSLNTASARDYAASYACSLYDPERTAHYAAHLAGHEREIIALAAESDAGEPIFDPDFERDPIGIRERPDIAYLLRHFGVLHRVGIRLNDDRGWFDSITCQFAEAHGPARSHEIRSLREMRPHIAQALQMARAFRRLRARYGAVLGELDRLRMAVFVVSDDARLVMRNATADALLAARDVLVHTTGGRLVARDAIAANELARAVRDALDTVRRHGQAPRRLVALPDARTDAPCIAEVSPLQDTDRELDDLVSGVLITVVDPLLRDSIDLAGFDLAYALTPAEAAVAHLLVDGLTYAEIAERRDVTAETVKTQVGSLLRKTGSRNRTELVRRALLLNVPVDDG